MEKQNNEVRQGQVEPTVRHLFTREYKVNGGTYEDAITVKGKFVFGRLQRIVYRAVCDGYATVDMIHGVLPHKGFRLSKKQIHSALQGLRQKGFVEFINSSWEVKP